LRAAGQSEAKSLDKEIDFFSNHQEGLYRGNMRMINVADYFSKSIDTNLSAGVAELVNGAQ